MKVLNFLEKQWKLMTSLLGIMAVVGAAFAFVTFKKEQTEKKAQETYFAVEKKLFELKLKKETQQTAKSDKKTKTEESVDFTQIKKDLENVIQAHPGTVASQMAAIHLSSLLVEEKQFDLALQSLKKAQNKNNGLVSTLLDQQIGQLMADQNNCQEAINVWQKIVDRKESSFIHNEVKLQQALCYAKINDLKKAEEILTQLANQTVNPDMSDVSNSKEAEKYLRLIQFKKASGT